MKILATSNANLLKTTLLVNMMVETAAFIGAGMLVLIQKIQIQHTLPTAEILSGKNARACVSMDFT